MNNYPHSQWWGLANTAGAVCLVGLVLGLEKAGFTPTEILGAAGIAWQVWEQSKRVVRGKVES